MSQSTGTKRKRQDVAQRKQKRSTRSISNQVIKRCLLDILTPQYAVQTLTQIQDHTLRQCKIALLTSRLMHMYLVDFFQTSAMTEIVISQNLIKQAMCTITTCSSNRKVDIPSRMLDIFETTFVPNILPHEYDDIIVSRNDMSKTNLQYLANMMLTNYTTSLEVNFEQRTKSWIRIQLYNIQHQPTHTLVSTLYQLCTRQLKVRELSDDKRALILPYTSSIVAYCHLRFPIHFNVNTLKKHTTTLLSWSYQVLHDIEKFNEQNPSPIRKFHQFSLFPVSRWTLGYITYDITKLQSLSLHILRHNDWKQLFRWKESYNDTQLRQFVNLTTDGVGVSLVFEKSTYRRGGKNMDVNELSTYIQQLSSGPDHTFKHMIGIDTGRINFFVASIRNNISHHDRPSTLHQDDTIKLSNSHWKYLRGTTKQSKQVNTWLHQRVDIQNIQSVFPTIKTRCPIQTMFHIEYFLQHFVTMVTYYTAKRFTRMKMNAYINEQKAWNQVIKKLESSIGGKEEVSKTLLIIGNPTFAHNSPGYSSTPVKSLYSKLKSKTLFQLVEIDEYKTSQICSRCLEMVEPWDRGKGIIPRNQIQRKTDQRWRQYPWSVRVCSNKLCHTHWNRDTNAARNMVYIQQHIIYHGTRPTIFTRHHRSNSISATRPRRPSRPPAQVSRPKKKQRTSTSSVSHSTTTTTTTTTVQSNWICPHPSCQQSNPSTSRSCWNCLLERE